MWATQPLLLGFILVSLSENNGSEWCLTFIFTVQQADSHSAGPRLGLLVLIKGMEEYLDQFGTLKAPVKVIHGTVNLICGFYWLMPLKRLCSQKQSTGVWPWDRVWSDLRYVVDGLFIRFGTKVFPSLRAMQHAVSDICRLFLEHFDKTTCLGSHN